MKCNQNTFLFCRLCCLAILFIGFTSIAPNCFADLKGFVKYCQTPTPQQRLTFETLKVPIDTCEEYYKSSFGNFSEYYDIFGQQTTSSAIKKQYEIGSHEKIVEIKHLNKGQAEKVDDFIFDFPSFNQAMTVKIEDEGKLYLYKNNGSPKKYLLTKPLGMFGNPVSWSSDNSRFYFDEKGQGSYCIFEYSLKDDTIKRIAGIESEEYGIHFPVYFETKTKRHVVFISNKGISEVTQPK